MKKEYKGRYEANICPECSSPTCRGVYSGLKCNERECTRCKQDHALERKDKDWKQHSIDDCIIALAVKLNEYEEQIRSLERRVFHEP